MGQIKNIKLHIVTDIKVEAGTETPGNKAIWQNTLHQFLEQKKTKLTVHFILKLGHVAMETNVPDYTINQRSVKHYCCRICFKTHKTK